MVCGVRLGRRQYLAAVTIVAQSSGAAAVAPGAVALSPGAVAVPPITVAVPPIAVALSPVDDFWVGIATA